MRNEKGSKKGNYGKVKASPQNKKSANKMPKPSKHHDVKPKKRKGFSSIKQRVEMANRNSSLAHTHKGFKTGYSVAKANASVEKKQKKKKKKKGGPRAFEMKIPNSNNIFLKRVDVPWYDSAEGNARIEALNEKITANDEDSDCSDTDDHDMAALQLPSENILSSIDTDIKSFCAYIKLGPVELRARQAFVDEITGIALNQFGKGGRNRNSRVNDEQDEIKVVPFGSFATQPVCTFASDVDMCLWGVVKGEKEADHLTFVDDDENEASQTDAFVLDQGQLKRDECPLLTESSLLRTMEAIQNASQQSTKEPKQKEEEDASPSEKKLISSTLKTSDKRKHHHSTTTTSKEKDTKEPKRARTAYNFYVEHALPQLTSIGRIASGTSVNTVLGEQWRGMSMEDKLPYERMACEDRRRYVEEMYGTSKTLTEEAQSPPDKLKTDDNVNNDLFFIDRVGESVEDDKEKDNAENAMSEIGQDNAKSATSRSKPVSKRGFQFEIDLAGVKELGGDVEDLNECAKPIEVEDQHDKGNVDAPKTPLSEKIEQPSDVVVDNENVPAQESAGTSRETAIEIVDNDDDESKSEVIVIDSDDEDDTDKLASFYSRQINASEHNGPHNTSTSPINLLHTDDSSCESAPVEVDGSGDSDEQENEVMELSLTSSRTSTKPPAKPVIGCPKGKTRNKVVSVLLSLTNQLRRSSFTHTIECRSRARVPIINCSTRTGFEGDIAIGGHNGVDTSMYAMSQVKRFKSFAPIVLIMKALMNQQDLDKPFTGGLGSYKLYVLVAYHIETHLRNGGNDRPSEILMTLFFRYGSIGLRRSRPLELTTDLVQLGNSGQMITCDGGTCELAPVFRLADCVEMFRECHERLTDRCLLVDDCSGAHQCSYLSSIIDCHSLREARESSRRRAMLCDNIITRPTPLNHPGKVSAGRRVSHVFTRHGSSVASKPDNNKRKNNNESAVHKRSKSDSTQRGPRGGLVPKNRPDLSARKNLSPEAAVMQRGMKQRKNKKKQTRDKELTRFASRHSF